MAERYVGIEVTPLHIRLMKCRHGVAKVHNFFSESFSAHLENISQQLSSAISNINIKTRKARIAMSETHPPLCFTANTREELIYW